MRTGPRSAMALTVKSVMTGWTMSKCLVFVLTVSVYGNAQVPARSGTAAAPSNVQPLVSPEVQKTAWEILATAATDNKASRRQSVIVATSTIATWSKAVGLVESLLHDKDSDVRALAAAALAEM